MSFIFTWPFTGWDNTKTESGLGLFFSKLFPWRLMLTEQQIISITPGNDIWQLHPECVWRHLVWFPFFNSLINTDLCSRFLNTTFGVLLSAEIATEVTECAWSQNAPWHRAQHPGERSAQTHIPAAVHCVSVASLLPAEPWPGEQLTETTDLDRISPEQDV